VYLCTLPSRFLTAPCICTFRCSLVFIHHVDSNRIHVGPQSLFGFAEPFSLWPGQGAQALPKSLNHCSSYYGSNPVRATYSRKSLLKGFDHTCTLVQAIQVEVGGCSLDPVYTFACFSTVGSQLNVVNSNIIAFKELILIILWCSSHTNNGLY